ncbi:MAG: hypothetical protein ACOCY0_00950 [Roseicyclus sp.]
MSVPSLPPDAIPPAAAIRPTGMGHPARPVRHGSARKACRPLLALGLLAAVGLPAAAQDFMGLDLGMTRAEAEARNGPPARTGPANPGYASALWVQPGGNELSVTHDASGRIVYMETFRGERAPPSTGPGVRFGATARAEFLQGVGSAGLVFPGRGPSVDFGGGTAHFHSYEIAGRPGAVVTFVFLAEAGSSADTALLDSVVVSDIAYQSAIWGGAPQAVDAAYRPLDIDF